MQSNRYFLLAALFFCSVPLVAVAEDTRSLHVVSSHSVSQPPLVLSLLGPGAVTPHLLIEKRAAKQQPAALEVAERAKVTTRSPGTELLRSLERESKSLLLTPWLPGSRSLGVKVEMAW
jgi:hypothetical protein